MLTATPRKDHRDLPVFFDLNDALEEHDAEEYAASPAPCGRCSPVTMIRRKRSFISAVSRQLKYPANKYIFF